MSKVTLRIFWASRLGPRSANRMLMSSRGIAATLGGPAFGRVDRHRGSGCRWPLTLAGNSGRVRWIMCQQSTRWAQRLPRAVEHSAPPPRCTSSPWQGVPPPTWRARVATMPCEAHRVSALRSRGAPCTPWRRPCLQPRIPIGKRSMERSHSRGATHAMHSSSASRSWAGARAARGRTDLG